MLLLVVYPENVFDVGGEIVISLIRQADVPANAGHRLFFDNYFSRSAHLANRGYCVTPTIQM